MAFLPPCFLLGLGAIAIPVLIHLIQREKKRVIEFPSLMFVRRIPYQSVRRRRIRHWWLLLMRAAAIPLCVRGAAGAPSLVPAADAGGGDRPDRGGLRASVHAAGCGGRGRERRRAR